MKGHLILFDQLHAPQILLVHQVAMRQVIDRTDEMVRTAVASSPVHRKVKEFVRIENRILVAQVLQVQLHQTLQSASQLLLSDGVARSLG